LGVCMFRSRYCFAGLFIHVDVKARIEEDFNFQFDGESNSNLSNCITKEPLPMGAALKHFLMR